MKYLKWIGVVVASLLIIDLISYLFADKPEPIPETLEINITKSEVYGKNSDYLSIVPGKYVVHYKNGDILLKVKLRLEDYTEEDYDIEGPYIHLKDEMGADVTGSTFGSSLSLSSSEHNKMISFLKSELGDEQEFIFSDVYPQNPLLVMKDTRGFSLENLEFKKPEEENVKKNNKQVEEFKNGMETLGEIFDEASKEVLDDEEVQKAVDDMEKVLNLSEKALELTKTTMELTKEAEKQQK